ncbi:MAG: SMC-Scp complex subunit ScpB, partial [Nitrospira sp.]|nr:SMC-Scp complex subunit ScpB [Nitrospira sp.]
ERKLVRIVGRKEVPGRPIMYGTTKYFLEHFGLNDLSQLPPLREFKELGESEQAMLPMDDGERLTTNGVIEATDTPVVQVVFDQNADSSETTAEAPDETGAPLSVDPDTSLLDEPVQQV